MKKLMLLVLLFMFSILPSFAALMDSNLLDIKMEINDLYDIATEKHKLPTRKIQRLDEIKAGLDDTKKDINSNVVPIYYKLALTYRAINKDEQAIDCFRTIAKYYPASPLRKKCVMYLKYYGEAIEVDGMTRMLPYKEDSTEVETETLY